MQAMGLAIGWSREVATCTASSRNGWLCATAPQRHSASTGWEIAQRQRTDRRKTSANGSAPLQEFGENIDAHTQRLALYAQDEWDWRPSCSLYAVARWEAISTASDSVNQAVRNRSAVFTSLAHMAWQLPAAPRDQLQ